MIQRILKLFSGRTHRTDYPIRTTKVVGNYETRGSWNCAAGWSFVRLVVEQVAGPDTTWRRALICEDSVRSTSFGERPSRLPRALQDASYTSAVLCVETIRMSRVCLAGLSGRVVSASDCGVRGSRFESRRWQLCLSRRLLRYTVLSTGCAPLLQCLGRLSLLPSVGR